MSGGHLSLENVAAGYGQVQVLGGIDLEVAQGALVAVIGANGAGKSTLLRAITGLIPCAAGKITFNGTVLADLSAYQIVGHGLAMVPEGGRLFPFMTVLENLELGAYHGAAKPHRKHDLAEMLELFPILAERRRQLAGSLSGGERQMCAIARALMSRPSLLMLDEPSLGLSPLMVEKVFALVADLPRLRGMSVLLVEQNVQDALEMADTAYVLERGTFVKSGPGPQLLDDPAVQGAYLGL
jgi:branched-chain amino acid transport system ATP-binding protein